MASSSVVLLLLLMIGLDQVREALTEPLLVLPLVKSSKVAAERSTSGKRGLLDSARMDLHDDLLTKGYYTTRLSIGTPPHEFALIVDTGSTVTYVPCSSCTHCGHHQDPRFSPEASTSYEPLGCGNECLTGFCDGNKHCKYERQYAEMSTSSGVLGRDIVSFSNSSGLGKQRLIFGCETVETGDLYSQTADGIIGLGRGSLSIVDQLVKQKSMDDSFSLCYGGMDQGGGAMILGKLEPPPEMVFTYSDPQRSPYYNLQLTQISVGGSPLPVKSSVFNGKYGTVLDSGTTYAYFPDAAFTAFANALKQHAGGLQEIAGPDPSFNDICYAGAGTDVSKLSDHFPSVAFVFGDGKNVTLSPENYLFRHAKVRGAYCLGIFKNGKDPTTLLGGIIVRNMLVSYDRSNNKIGFWKTNCNNLWNELREPQHSVQPQELFPTESPAPAPAPAPASSQYHPVPSKGVIEISMLMATNYSTFSASTSEFVNDITRELDASVDQVNILNYTTVGSDVSVRWVFFPADVNNQQLNTTAKSIVSRLQHHELRFSQAFGVYNLTSWRVIPYAQQKRPPGITHIALAIAAALLLVSVAGFAIYWQVGKYRHKHTYQTIVEDPPSVQMQEL